MEHRVPHDVDLLETIFLPRHEDAELRKLAETTCTRIRAEDSQLGLIRRKWAAPGAFEFAAVASIVEDSFAVICWEWLEEEEDGEFLAFLAACAVLD